MKKIINNKVYDTDTAKELASWSSDNANRLDYIDETLYRKKTGEYFLLGEGGPRTQYAREAGTNSWSSGDRIMPMTYQEASDWAQSRLSGEKYEELFGAVREDDSRRTVTYSLAVASVDKLRRLAEQRGISASELLDQLIQGA